ncbi:MAG: ABC transporter ATP-binding protein [Planctomycetes bacterium]|nr:ABC transporter ATP-binding protein [Planctomycetota bacterium]
MNVDAPLLSARGIGKSYGDGPSRVRALEGIDLDVRAGEIVAVCGPSGSGKSTLLNLLGLLDRPDAGTLAVHGQGAERMGDRARSRLRRGAIGFVFQSFHLIRELSLLENVALPARIAGASGREAERRARALLAQMGLSPRERHRPHQVSGGELQRAAFARALVNRPAVVLCDEPTGNLDGENRQRLREMILERSASDRQAFVIATHDPKMARIAHRRLWLADGRPSPEPAGA